MPNEMTKLEKNTQALQAKIAAKVTGKTDKIIRGRYSL
jgi:hypothetical protein